MYVCLRLIGCILYLASTMQPALAVQNHPKLEVVQVDVPLQEWLDDYLAWTQSHPQSMHKTANSASPHEPLLLKMPFLELDAPTGVVLYRGTGAAQNAAFLQHLHEKTPSSPAQVTDLRPTLSEYADMIAQLRPYKRQITAGNKPTLLAVTFPGKPFCEAQNQAITQWEKQTRIRVIEIKLHP